MDIKVYESLILSELKKVIENILLKNTQPNISAKSRAGAEISSLLEEQFVKETAIHNYFKKSQASPDGATKHPWDAITHFCLKGHEEVIWIDFKAFKTSSKNSNPAIGSTNKIIELIQNGKFYLMYIYVYYEETTDGLKFVQNSDNEFVKIYFLKDVHASVWRDPTGQLQVNFKKKQEYRTREEFIKLLLNKMKEGYERQIENAQKGLNKLNQGNILNMLLDANEISEAKIKKL